MDDDLLSTVVFFSLGHRSTNISDLVEIHTVCIESVNFLISSSPYSDPPISCTSQPKIKKSELKFFFLFLGLSDCGVKSECTQR